MAGECGRKKNRVLLVLILLTVLGMGAQAVPFFPTFVFQDISSDDSSAIIPLTLPAGYGIEDYATAEDYNRPFVAGVLFRRITLILGLLSLIVSGCGYWYDEKFGRGWWRWPARFSFFFLMSLGFEILTLPYQVAGYFHSLAFGISELALGEWIRIQIVSFPAPMALFVFQCVIIYCFMHLFGKRWWVTAALFICLLGIVPEFINHRPIELVAELEPLEEGRYRTELDELGQAAGVQLEMLVEDRSIRATTTNVYLGGRASSRFVVLTDTFLKSFTPGEAAVAVAHELGHIQNELPALIVHKSLTLLTLLVAFLTAYGLTGRKRIAPNACLQAVIISILCLLCAEYFFQPVRSAIARWEERKADEYCLTMTDDPESFGGLLIKSARINLAQLKVPRWKYYYFSQYPDVLDRVVRAEKRLSGALRFSPEGIAATEK